MRVNASAGTGALSTAILSHCNPASVTGVDPSPACIAWATSHLQDDRVRFETGDATLLPKSIVDVVISGLVLKFVPNPFCTLARRRSH